MTSRRAFITAAAATAAASLAGLGDSPPAQSAAKAPSPAALALAKSLQKSLPKARLSDELIKKIAGDIDGNASIGESMSKSGLHNWDEPDFTFVAESAKAQR